MKNWLILGGISLIAVLFLIWLFLFGRGGGVENPDTKEPIGDVSTLSPSLTLETVSGSSLEVSTEGEEAVSLGDHVKTGENGRGLVTLNSGSITVVDYSTDFIIEGGDSETRIALSSGNLWARVEKLLGQGEYYEIETPNAVAVVRGTSFGFGFINFISSLVVVDGVVGLIPKDPKTGERLIDKEEKILAGEKATIGADGLIKRGKIGKNDKNEWYLFNNPEEVVEEPSVLKPPSAQTLTIPTNPSPPPPEIITSPTPPPLLLNSILPSKTQINPNNPQMVTLSGEGFLKVTRVVIGKNSVPGNDVVIKSDKQILLYIGGDNTSGVYDVTVIDLSGRSATLPKALTLEEYVVVEEPPREEPPYNPNNYLYNQPQ